MATAQPHAARRFAILILLVAVQYCAGFSLHHGRSPMPMLASGPTLFECTPYTRQSRRYATNDENEEGKQPDEATKDERDGYTWAELQADPELRKVEFDSSMNRKNRLFLPGRISAAVSTVGWLFVGVGLILNAVGYAWVKDPSGGLGVGTLDERAFQKEIMRERRIQAQEAKESAVPVARAGIANEHVSSWLNQQEDSFRV